MPTAIKNPLDYIKDKFTSALKTQDPDNVDISPSPSQLIQDQLEQSQREQDYVALLTRNLTAAKSHKDTVATKDIVTGVAFFQDMHWHRYKDGVMQVVDNSTDLMKVPFIKGFVQKRRARVCSQYPDVWPAPLTSDDRDKLAAQTARSINAHCFRRNDRMAMVREWVTASLTESTAFIKVTWSPTAIAEVATTKADGTVEYVKAPIGDVDECVIHSGEMFIDPAACGNFQSAGYVIHNGVKPLAYVQETYKCKERGLHVEPDVFDSNFEQLASSGSFGGSSNRKNAVVISEMWVKPCPRYPKGLVVTTAGKVLLRCTDWPYDVKDKYPFIPLGYEARVGSPWAMNMVTPLVDGQIAYNSVITKMVKRANWDKITIFMNNASNVDVDFYENAQDYNKISGNGMPPQFLQPQSPGGFYDNLLQRIYKGLCDTTGIHDLVSDDGLPAGLSGIALELYEESDRNRDLTFLGAIESGLAGLAEWEIEMYRQFAVNEYPRMMAIDDQSIPSNASGRKDMAGAQKVEMQSLKDGACRVYYTPGSGIAKTAAAKEEELQKWVQLGAFGKPGDPSVAHAVAALSQTIRSSDLVDNVLKIIDQQAAQDQANQPNPAAIAQAQAQAAQQQQSMLLQFKQQELELQQQHDVAKMDAEQSHAIELAAIKAHEEEQKQTFIAQSQIAIKKADTDEAIRLGEATTQQKIRLMQAENALPKVSLTGKLDNDALVSAEKQLGYETASPDEIRKQQVEDATKPADDKPSSQD